MPEQPICPKCGYQHGPMVMQPPGWLQSLSEGFTMTDHPTQTESQTNAPKSAYSERIQAELMSLNTMQQLECFISALTDEIERLSGLMKLGTQNLKKSLNAQKSSRDQQPATTSGPSTLMDAEDVLMLDTLLRRLNSDENVFFDTATEDLYSLRRYLEQYLKEREP